MTRTSSESSPTPRLAVLGTGVMGEAVLAGALAGDWSASDVVATTRRSERAAQLESAHGVSTTDDNAAAVTGARLVLVAVKPKDVAALLAAVSGSLAPDAVVVSVVAGLGTAFFEKHLPAGTRVVRTMPNTPTQIGAGVTAISPGKEADADDLALVERLLAGTGLVIRVAEKDQNAVSALSGSGPAYVFYVIDALAEAGVLLGLTRAVSLQIATQTVLGSARLVDVTGEHPALLREKVSSPGGTTVAALRKLDAGGVRAAFLDALEAARDRSEEIAAALATKND